MKSEFQASVLHEALSFIKHATDVKKPPAIPALSAVSIKATKESATFVGNNMDVAVSGTKFGASSVPSLKQFIRDVARAVPSPKGGTVYEAWQKASQTEANPSTQSPAEPNGESRRTPAAQVKSDVPVGDLGSGSDYTAFLQHLGVPAADVSSSGSYGVYHSVFDNFAWFKKYADPDFVYLQQMARVFGLEAVRMANADVLPYDYEEYGKEVVAYLDTARRRADDKFANHALAFDAVNAAARHPYVSHLVSEPTSDTITCVLRRAASVQGPPSRSTGMPRNRSL